jgi:Tol biopolymer transport system component
MTTHRGRILIGLMAALLALGACDGGGEAPTTTGAEGSSIEGRLLYEVYDGGSGVSLFAMDAGGGPAEDLGVFTDPGSRWSPDGTRILVTSTAGPAETVNPFRPATVAIDGSDFRLLDGVDDEALNLACTAFSPDGTLLACQRYSDFEIGLTTVRASDGGELHALTDFNSVPSDFSPAGDQIVFLGGDATSTSFAEEVGTLYVVGTDGTNLRAITEPNSVLGYSYAAWSPDGEWIVFLAADGTLGLVHADGSEQHTIALGPDVAAGGATGGATWSPDGGWIAFSARPAGGDEPDLFVVRPDGTELRQITSTPDVAEFMSDWAS